MQTIVEGNPGSGKSFFAVKYLLKYCEYDAMFMEYILRSDVLIISNIENLKIKHLSLDELLKRYNVEEFFTVENFEKIQKQYKVKNIILCIDEAQKIFDSKFFNKDVFYLFQYHRHLGLDIFLLTQSRSTICRQLIPLAEYIVQAKPRSKGISGTFTYNYLDPKGNYMYNKTLRADPSVFRAYQSMRVDEMNKPRNVIKYYAMMGSAVFVVVFLLFKSFFAWFKVESHPEIKNKTNQVVKNITPVSNVEAATIPAFKNMTSAAPISKQPVAVPIAVSVPVDSYQAEAQQHKWVALDMVSKLDGKMIVSLKGFHGVFKIPDATIQKLDVSRMVAYVDTERLIPMK